MVSKEKPLRIGGLFQTGLSEKQKKNSALNIREFEQKKPILYSYPRRVLLELTNMCNYRCIMCGRNFETFRPTYFDMDIIDSLKEVFENAEEVTLFGWGEPTVHPEFSEIMEKLSQFKTLRKYILTNGSNLGYIKKLIKKGSIDILAVSLDGATADINNSIRKGSDFEYITKKLKEITAMKEQGIKIPFINLVFVIMEKNVHQLPEMVKLTKELGIPELKAVYMTSFNEELDNKTIWQNNENYKEYFKKAEAMAEELGVLVKFPPFIGEDSAGDAFHKECGVAWRDLFISSDSHIRPCQSTCFKIAELKDYDISNSQGFFKLWNCEKFQKFRETVNDNEKMEPNCKTCYQSSHANWNKKHAHIQTGQTPMPDWKI